MTYAEYLSLTEQLDALRTRWTYIINSINKLETLIATAVKIEIIDIAFPNPENQFLDLPVSVTGPIIQAMIDEYTAQQITVVAEIDALLGV